MERKISWFKCIGAIICAAAAGTVANIIACQIPQGGMGETEYYLLLYCVTSFLQAIGLISVLFLFKRKEVLTTRPKGSFVKGLLLSIVLICYGAYMLITNLISCISAPGKPSMALPFVIVFFAGIFLGAGIGEEFVYRGVIMNFVRSAAGDKTRKGLLIGMTVSSVLFGLCHLANLDGSSDVVGTIGQVIYATGIGFYLAGIYARTKNIWFNVVLHFFVDIAALIKTIYAGSEVSISEVIGGDPLMVILRSILIGVVFGGMGLFMVRKSKMPELA